jgi:hypothetical protein
MKSNCTYHVIRPFTRVSIRQTLKQKNIYLYVGSITLFEDLMMSMILQNESEQVCHEEAAGMLISL